MKHILLLLYLLVSVSIHAQENTQLTLGESVQVTISADSPAVVTYELSDAPQYITIRANAADSGEDILDAVVWIVDEQSRVLAYNDNIADESNPEIQSLLLATNGIYTIYVDSFNGVSEGEIEILIEESDPFSEASEINESLQIVNFTLPSDTIYSYSFEATEDTEYIITARDTSNTLDPYLALFDDEGNIIIANDDHRSTDTTLNIFDAQISSWVAPTDAIYTVEIRDFLGNSGQIALTIEAISP